MSADRFPGIDRGIGSTVPIILGRVVPFAENLEVNPDSARSSVVEGVSQPPFRSGSISFSERLKLTNGTI